MLLPSQPQGFAGRGLQRRQGTKGVLDCLDKLHVTKANQTSAGVFVWLILPFPSFPGVRLSLTPRTRVRGLIGNGKRARDFPSDFLCALNSFPAHKSGTHSFSVCCCLVALNALTFWVASASYISFLPVSVSGCCGCPERHPLKTGRV